VLIPDTCLFASDAALAPSGKRSASTALLVEYITEEFPGVQIDAVERQYWNDAGGKPSWTFSFRLNVFWGLNSSASSASMKRKEKDSAYLSIP
jgi:hypothetical protein